jgi:hypothetical protein
MPDNVSATYGEDRVGRTEILCLSVAVLIWVGVSAQDAGIRPFWFDEIFTYVGSGTGSVENLVGLLMRGFDPTPVLFYYVSSLVRALGPPEIGLRIPAIVGFAVGMACNYLVARRWAGWGYAALAAVVPALFFGDLNLEARPYGLVLGFCGLALLGWSYRDRLPRLGPVLFLFGILCGAGCHYYAFLIGLPFGVAALWQLARARKLDLLTLGGASMAVLPNLLALPLIRSNIAIHAPGAWNVPSWHALLYSSYSLELGLLVGLFLLMVWLGFPKLEVDVICWLGFAALPFVATLLAKTVSGMVHPRYTSVHTLGVGLVVAWALGRLLPRVRLFDYAGVGLAVAALAGSLFGQAEKTSEARLGTDYIIAEATELLGRPVFQKASLAIPDQLLALPLWFYSAPALQARMVFPVDKNLELQYMEYNSVQDGKERHMPLRTEPLMPYFKSSTEDIMVLDAAYFPGRSSSFLQEYLTADPALAARTEVVRDYAFGSFVLLRGVGR